MATVTRYWDDSTDGEMFKKFLRKVHDTTERATTTFWQDVYNAKTTKDEWERDREIAGLGLAQEMTEGRIFLYRLRNSVTLRTTNRDSLVLDSA